jgi:hypothetical protein
LQIDTLKVPTGIYRGFRSLADAPDALLMAIGGGPDAGKVAWHPSHTRRATACACTNRVAKSALKSNSLRN